MRQRRITSAQDNIRFHLHTELLAHRLTHIDLSEYAEALNFERVFHTLNGFLVGKIQARAKAIGCFRHDLSLQLVFSGPLKPNLFNPLSSRPASLPAFPAA